MADIHTLINLESINCQLADPDTLVSYIPHGTLIMYEIGRIPVSSTCLKPLTLLKWDREASTLLQVCEEVSGCYCSVSMVLFTCKQEYLSYVTTYHTSHIRAL